jgi:ribosomal protein S18 acetylase RimI-like enzyme
MYRARGGRGPGTRRRTTTQAAATYLDQVRSAYRARGVRLVAHKVAARFKCEVLLYAFDLERELPSVSSNPALELRQLTERDMDAYLALRPDEDAPTARKRLRRGDLGLALWSGDRVVGAVWARFDRVWISELGRSLRVEPEDAYGYAAFVAPGHRRGGAATALYLLTLQRLRSLGYRRALSYVAHDNLAGRAPLWRLGFEYVGSVRWFHVGRVGLELLTGWGERRRVRVHVRSHRDE